MKVAIQDPAVLGSIRPARVTYYVRSRGWKVSVYEQDRYSLWTQVVDGDLREVLVPLATGFPDFAQRMADLLEDLQRLEQRSQLEILYDIETSSCDVFRFRKEAHPSFLGAIQIEAGAKLVGHVRDFMLYAATAEEDPRKKGPGGRRPDDVARFMNSAMLGQTEVSSFVVRAQVPVPGLLNADLFPEGISAAGEPFERRAGIRLMNVLSWTRDAAVDAIRTGDIRPFSELLNSGATVGLYSTVVEAQEVDPSSPLEIKATWAAARPMVGPPPATVVVFDPEIIPPLEEAVTILRPRVPRVDIQVFGNVSRLERPGQESLLGQLAIDTLVDGRPRKVRLSLFGEEYDKAIDAFKAHKPVLITGDLVKGSHFWELRQPRDLRVAEDPDEAAAPANEDIDPDGA